MSHEFLKIESSGGTRVITLNRPEKRNALTKSMCADLKSAWQDFEQSQDRVAVIRAAGNAFTAGLDFVDPPRHFWEAIPGLGVPVTKPVIAAVQGPVIAAGVSLIAFCDLCVAGKDAVFSYPEARLGNAAGLISSLIPRIPHKIAMELMLLGGPITAQRAYEVGLANRLCDTGDETAVALEMANSISKSAPMVLGFLKSTARQALPRGPIESMYLAQAEARWVSESADAVEGALAAREGRVPNFVGA